MQWPSFSVILVKIFLVYIAYSMYTLSQLFVTPVCKNGKPCLKSYLSEQPQLDLYIYSSVRRNPASKDVDLVYMAQNFNYNRPQIIPTTFNIPRKTQQNGTLFLHVLLFPSSMKQDQSFRSLQDNIFTSYVTIKMSQYIVPEAETFKLLGEKDSKPKKDVVLPVSHIYNHMTFMIMTDNIALPAHGMFVELMDYIKIVGKQTYLPIVSCNFLKIRHRNLQQITSQNNTMNVTLEYWPATLGMLRFILHVEATIETLKNFGISDKELDEVKSIFADTNIYLLGGTFFIAAIHLLFDCLAIKSDVSFWRKKSNLVGLSKWTVMWRAFSQSVIFLYLCDERSSLLVLVPAGVSSIIEVWKLKKIYRMELMTNKGFVPRIQFRTDNINVAELKTRKIDAESMRYLSYLLYPLVIAGAIYSLFYQPHKSWYSWSLNSLVNGVYAFGFLFMLPQLFVNYKLKSVAHMPWRAFMYKAFNTFIDDIFAFIITMPTAHRIACFRDDVVFLIYLYQRWLYPVDNMRTDTDTITEEAVDFNSDSKKKN